MTTSSSDGGRGIGSSARVMLRLTLRDDDDDESDGASDLRFEDVECGLTDLFALTREFERARAAVVANESTTTGATTGGGVSGTNATDADASRDLEGGAKE